MATQAIEKTSIPLMARIVGTNGVVTTLLGAAALLGAGVLPTAFGLPQPVVIAFSAICLVAGPLLLWLVSTNRLSRQFVWALAISEVVWVAASIEALVFGWLSPTSAGWWAIVLQADIVALFAALEFYALRKK